MQTHRSPAAGISRRDFSRFLALSGSVLLPPQLFAWPAPLPQTPDRRAAPAGSVYRLLFDTEAAALAAAKSWHGRGFAQSNETLRTAGFGLVLVGSW